MRPLYFLIAVLGLAVLTVFSQTKMTDSQTAGERRPRARDLGLEPGVFPPGKLNAITDVAGVKVGHVTLIEGEHIRTGVTAILPHGGNLFQDKVAGAVFVGNAFGKLAGSTQVNELGTIETPIILTNTLSVGAAIEGVVAYTLAQSGNEQVFSVNALVGETNDGALNDIRGMHVKQAHVIAAIKQATDGAVVEGSVGAGTGTTCFGWKGGIGTSSRKLPERYGGYTVGVLVQTNFGGVLTMGGAPVGKELKRYAYSPGNGDGSCMIVVATDAPLDARDLQRLAARALFGLARTGSSYSNGSGDFAIAFSTSPEMRSKFGEATTHWAKLEDRIARGVGNPCPLVLIGLPDTIVTFHEGRAALTEVEAALEATEEAVYNSLLQATTTRSRNRTVEAIPIDRVKEILKKYSLERKAK